MKGKWSLRKRLFALVVAFSVVFLAFALVATVSMRKIAINGGLYTEIVNGKDVIADVLPPPNYVIESYLLIHQMLETSDPDQISDLVARSKRLREEYDTRGSGLGLSMTRDVLQKHQGSITVESAPGQGSTFTLRLPGIVRDQA